METVEKKLWKGEYLHIVDLGRLRPKAKTNKYHVVSNRGNTLGWVRWYAPWKRYVFYPENLVLLEQVCMRDLADFVEDRTKELKKTWV